MNINSIIDEVFEINESECISPLSKRQICNIAEQLMRYPIKSEEDFRYALEYSTKIRSEVIFYTTHYLNTKYQQRYKYYSTIDYSISRTLSTMGLIESDNEDNFSDSDKVLKTLQESIERIESELRIKLKEKKELVFC